eukprot:203290-Pyramimonas_sp.AAC.1
MQAAVANQPTEVQQHIHNAITPRLDAISRKMQAQLDEHSGLINSAATPRPVGLARRRRPRAPWLQRGP